MDLSCSFSWMTSRNYFSACLLVVQENFSFICTYPSNWAVTEQGMAPSRPRKNTVRKCWFCEQQHQQRLVCFHLSHFPRASPHPCRGALSDVSSWLSPWDPLGLLPKLSFPQDHGAWPCRAAHSQSCWVRISSSFILCVRLLSRPCQSRPFLIHVNGAKKICTKPRISSQSL